MDELIYRPSVAAILRRWNGEILVCERADANGCWQFPQGGMERSETPQAAVRREIEEEISLKPHEYAIREQRGPYRYVFGSGQMKKGAHGQQQTYFLMDLLAPESAIDVRTPKPEFRAVRWVLPTKFDLNWLPPMKVEVYRAVLFDFFGAKL